MNVYTTNHQHSRIICSAFAEGTNGKIVPPVKLLDGDAMVYGILRGCGEIIRECEWINRTYFYVDHGYFKRGYYDGHFRVVRNGLQTAWTREIQKPDRWEALKIELRPWIRKGKHIVVCPISKYLSEFLRISQTKWVESVTTEIRRHTDREIVIKQKNEGDLREIMKDAWCLVTHSSNAAVDAVVNGIPCIVLGNSAAEPVSWNWDDIESPVWPEREPWCWELAYNQFTLEEMRRGIDLSRL